MKRWFAILVILVGTGSARAQLAVYGMGGAGKLSGFSEPSPAAPGANPGLIITTGNFWAYGGTAGIYDDFLKLGPIKLGGDVRGFVEKSSNSNNTYGNQLRGGLIGLRLALHAPLVPVKPYIQAEIGGASTNYGQNSSNTGNFAYQVQLGVDFTIFPHIDLRGEYGVGQLLGVLGGNNSNMQQLGAGLAVRF
jgi:hypothetical protein